MNCVKNIIKAMERFDKDYEILENKNDSNAKILRKEYYKKFFNNITSSAIIKKLIKKYIENFSEILECQNIFKESLTFQFDENHEYIDKVKIDFFEMKSLFENKNKERRNKKMKKKKYLSNLYYIIDVLKYEKLYHDNIINTIKEINIFNELPIFMIYKYYLFFDIFEGGFVPLEISSKLYYATSNNLNALNNKITKQIYSLLKSKYNYRNNKMNSKFFVMYKYKKDLRIKYFNEEFALRLGFQQKDLINKKIDVLMPKEFCKSHQNLIKKLLIGDQLKYYNLNKSYVFNKSCTKLYPIVPKGTLIYDLSKNLIVLSENNFFIEKEYNFMLNHNFNILAISNNFEEDYL